MHRLVVLYGVGGLSDVGRHAVQVALERSHDVAHVTVLTQHPELLLDETNWRCSCPEPHRISQDIPRLTVVPVQSWQTDRLESHFRDATAVISCLGNRNVSVGHWVAHQGNQAVIRALPQQNEPTTATPTATLNPHRVVVCSSVGIEEDWPAMEMFLPGKICLSIIFSTLGYILFRDLTAMERAYKATKEEEIDFLLVRPVGIGEDIVPVGKWALQQEKYKDDVGFNMAKLDVARFMVEEALRPTLHRTAVVIGPGLEETK